MKWPSRKIACVLVRNEYSRFRCSQRPCTRPTFGSVKVVDRFLEEVRFRHKIGVEYRNELALGCAQSVLQRARFESGSVVPVDVMNIQAKLLQRSTAFRAIRCVSSVESSSTWMSSLSRG